MIKIKAPHRWPPPPRLSRKIASPLNDFSLACLQLAAPSETPALRQRLFALFDAHGERAVLARLDDLRTRGYVTEGTIPSLGYLTDKGRAALARWA